MPLDLEEQEKVAELRAWWTQHGTLITAAVVIAALAVASWSGWHWYQRSQSVEASALYRNDLKAARTQLEWVVERSPSEEFRDLARLRLGAVLLDEKAFDEALKVAEAPHGAAFDAQFAALKGDVLVAKNEAAGARDAYRLALEKAGKEERAFRESVRMRLEGLGG
jgi:predicted negative regulator of RcsB-dependent stress response